MKTDTSFKVGRFLVVPQQVRGVAIKRFTVYLNARLIGSQMSYPSHGDCEQMLIPRVSMIAVGFPKWSLGKSPGRPRKDAPRRANYDDMD